MKKVGGGVLGVGIFAFGWALSVGFISISMNAVGWIAIGMNAAGFVSIGLINSIGVFSFGGVNSCGGWGRGGVNEGPSSWFGLAVSIAVALGLLIYRIKSWPAGETPLLVPLAGRREDQDWSVARLIDIGEQITLQGFRIMMQVEAAPAVVERCREVGRGSRVLVQLRRTMRPVEGAGYRDDAGKEVLELAAIVPDPRRGLLASLFSGTIGAHLVFSWLGLVAATIAFFVWR
jgi:hypothetical protein